MNAQKTLSHSKYCELVRIIVAAMEKVAPRPSFSQCQVVANYVGPMYPVALADPLTSASQSATFEGLARKLEIRIENCGRGGKRVAEELAEGKLKRATPRTTYGCPDWQPPLSSSVRDYEEPKKTLSEESMKSEAEQNVDIQRELMMSAFPAIRLSINCKNNRASDVRKEWPLLFTRRHFMSHFKRQEYIPVLLHVPV